jgi:hypothetical protein
MVFSVSANFMSAAPENASNPETRRGQNLPPATYLGLSETPAVIAG